MCASAHRGVHSCAHHNEIRGVDRQETDSGEAPQLLAAAAWDGDRELWTQAPGDVLEDAGGATGGRYWARTMNCHM
jgi:hypothetical protein